MGFWGEEPEQLAAIRTAPGMGPSWLAFWKMDSRDDIVVKGLWVV